MFQDGAERLSVLLNEKFCTDHVSTYNDKEVTERSSGHFANDSSRAGHNWKDHSKEGRFSHDGTYSIQPEGFVIF